MEKFRPDALKEARGRFGHSQQDAAQFLEVSQSVLSKWEQGVHAPAGLYAKAVAAYIRASKRR